MDVFVEAGADFQRKTRDGKTALQLSAGRRTDFGVEMNRSAGAEVHLTARSGFCVLRRRRYPWSTASSATRATTATPWRRRRR